jgi:hypothetical protein
MVAHNPFRGVDQARLNRFVALLAEDAPPAAAFPDPPKDAGYRLVARGERDLLFLIDRDVVKTPDLMGRLEKAFFKRLTTRTWGTMEKVAAAITAAEAP